MKQTLQLSVLSAFAIASLTAQSAGIPNGGNIAPGTGLSSIQSGARPFPEMGSPGASALSISGKVVVDDGLPAPQNIAIERTCLGSARTVAYTDGKGRFSFQWGNSNMSIVPDASDSGGFGVPSSGKQGSVSRPRPNGGDPMEGCELRANLTGFRSDSISLGQRTLDNPDVGLIVLHRLANVEGTSVSATALNAPKDAVKTYEKGVQSLHKGKLDDAAKEFQKAVEIDPKYANAWLDLGHVQLQQQMPEPARESFKKAIEADAKLVDAWAQLGLLAAQSSNWPDTAKYLDHALKLDPVEYPQLWLPDAVAGYNVKHLDVAERSAREALKLDPDHHDPKIDELLGNILVQKGAYAEAAEELRAYMQFAPNAPDLDQVKSQLAQIDLIAKEPKR